MIDKIARTYLERRAIVYLRQSTVKQVHEHRESTARQYALQRRAAELGWEADRVDVIDQDLGQSGVGIEWRMGFQRLAEDVAHGRVGAIFALEVSRLARSSADWHRLLDLCGLADVLIVDEQAIYSPRDYNDRLLLGLKGTMSEAELCWMRLRLQGGKLNKARRGELFLSPPTGYQWDEHAGRLRLEPDEQTQQAVRLIFERFRIDGSAYAVLRYFARHGLTLPVRDGATGEVKTTVPRYGAILRTVHNPAYAGAYVFGRREQRTALVDGKLRHRQVKRLPMAQWQVCLKDHHPGYIGWDEFMENQQKLHENRISSSAAPDRRGAAREGQALLQGLALCGRCGHRMKVAYEGVERRAYYECVSPRKSGHGRRCWRVSARALDEAVAHLFLQAVQPPEIELGLAVAREAERQSKELDRQWKLRLDRASYDARLAERRYKAVDPDNRVIARTLEREWNDKQKALEALEHDYSEARRRDKVDLSDDDRRRVLALVTDLPRVWHAPTTTPAERKNLLRMLVREVTLNRIDTRTRTTRIQVLWQTGAITELTVAHPNGSNHPVTSSEALGIIRTMAASGKADPEIAAALDSQGLRTGLRKPWTARAVRSVRNRYRLQRPPRAPREPLPRRRADGLYSVHGVAARLGVSDHIVRYWIMKGWLKAAEGGDRHACWFRLERATLERLRAIKAHGYGVGGRKHSQG